MKKILVPSDFSDNAFRAARYALDIANHLGSDVTLLNAYDVGQPYSSLKSFDRILEKEAHEEMAAFMEKLAPFAGKVVLEEKVLKGDPIPIIASMSDSTDYDLVIMGTKGATGLQEVFTGSVAGGVISKTKGPVMVIPESAVYSPPELIVFGVDGHALSSPAVAEPLIKIVKAYESDMTVLHLSDERSDELNEVLQMLKGLNFTTMYEFGKGEISKRINEYIEDSDADLLCLIRRKRGFIERVFGESVTLNQTFRSKVPLLILQD